MGMISVYEKIVIECMKKRKHRNKLQFLHECPFKRKFLSGIHSLRRRRDKRSSADIIYAIWRTLQFCASLTSN